MCVCERERERTPPSPAVSGLWFGGTASGRPVSDRTPSGYQLTGSALPSS
jgi:hypothetical protein